MWGRDTSGRKGSLVLVESIRTTYDVILLLRHIALRTMHDLSVGEGLVVAMLDSLDLCHFHISVNFFLKKQIYFQASKFHVVLNVHIHCNMEQSCTFYLFSLFFFLQT